MANESDIVVINVSLSGGGITRAGFGVDLILSNTGNAWATPELTRDYNGLAALEDDFATDTPEYQAAAQLMGQPVKPTLFKVGKGSHKPTMIKQIAISSIAGSVYKVNAYAGGVLQQATYTPVLSAAWIALTAYATGDLVTNDTGKLYICITAGTSAGAGGPTGTTSNITDGTVHWMYAGAGSTGVTTNDAIAYNIMKALNALAAPDIGGTSALSGSVGSKIVVTTGDAAGDWFALEPLASSDEARVSNLMALTDATTDPGVSTDLADILSADGSWYALSLLFKSAAILDTPSTGAAAWCEANSKLLLCSSADTVCATASDSGATDVLHVLKAAGYSYTAGMWHPRDYEWFDAAKDGYFLPLQPGSDNWRLKTYTGVTPVNLTPTQRTNLINRRAAFYYTAGNRSMDGGLGQVESPVYLFINTRRNIDWYAVNLQADLIDLLYTNNNLPHTDPGLRKIATAIAARNDVGIQVGVISGDPLDPDNAIAPIVEPYTVTVPRASDTADFDVNTRAQTGVSTKWKLAGSINSITVQVNVTQ